MNIIIYGKGDFAKLVLHYLKSSAHYKVIGFCVDADVLESSSYLDYPLYDIDEVHNFISINEVKFFLAVGYSSMPARAAMFNKIYNKGFELINIFCEGALVDPSVIIGMNNIFMPKVFIEPFSTIGDNNIFWSNTLICHDVKISNHNFFAANTVIGGFCKIGSGNFFGFNATVVDNLTINDNAVLGAASLLLSNIDKQGKYLGTPAKRVENIK